MNNKLKQEVEYVRRLTSKEALNWILHEYPAEGLPNGLPLAVFHRSWKKADQIELIQRYLGGTVFADAKVYSEFIKISSLKLFVREISKIIDQTVEKRDLLVYNLRLAFAPYLNSDEDSLFLKNFVDKYFY